MKNNLEYQIVSLINEIERLETALSQDIEPTLKVVYEEELREAEENLEILQAGKNNAYPRTDPNAPMNDTTWGSDEEETVK